MNVTVAGAPVSFGVFEMTPQDAETLSPDDVLDLLVETGYQGVDLGPVGYFGRGRTLRDRLQSRGLGLAGGWVQLPFTDDEAFARALPDLDDALAAFAEAADGETRRLPKPTLADAGSPQRQRAPGSGVDALTAGGWDRLATNVGIAADRVRAAGFDPTFHHHAGTFVESPQEIAVFLDRVDIGLTLDVGHLLIGGGDPVAGAKQWAPRVNHLHLKDVDESALTRVLAEGGGMREVWSSGVFTAFGSGDMDLPGVLDAMAASGYDGWIVVEQDVLPVGQTALSDFRRARTTDHLTNRQALRAWCREEDVR